MRGVCIHAGLGEGTICACGPALAAVTAGTSRARRQVDLGICEDREQARRGRGAELHAGPSSQEASKINRKNLKSPIKHRVSPRGCNEGTLSRQGALTEVAGSAFQHRNLKGEEETKKKNPIHKGSGVPAAGGGRRGRSGIRGGGSRGRPARPGKARGPAREEAGAAAPRPAPRAQAPPAAQDPREAGPARRRRRQLQVLSRQRAAPFRGDGHRGPAREGASRSLQREMGRAERRSRRKKRKKQAQDVSLGGYPVASWPLCARPARMGAADPGRRPRHLARPRQSPP